MSWVRDNSHKRRPELADVLIDTNVEVPTGVSDVKLSCTVHRPAISGKVPALLMVLPYRKDIWGSIAFSASSNWFAQRGYGVVLVNTLGIGSSDGNPSDPWTEDEADDAITAIDWAASQRWCSGHVGMWGLSHGGFAAMRAATRRSPHLKTIIPMMNALDVERDCLHPNGARGDFVRLLSWGGTMLMQQLIPPLESYSSNEQHAHWRRRMDEIEPFIGQLARLGPGHPAWRGRVIDASLIEIPALCVAGWNDVFPSSMIRAFEDMKGPKRLLVGPWGHTFPQDSPFDAIDFLSIALRWCDRWLYGIESDDTKGPIATIFIQGASPEWRTFDSWPPSSRSISFAATDHLRLVNAENDSPPDIKPESDVGQPIGVYDPDPTIGVLGCLKGIGFGSLGPSPDQHEDDSRSLSLTSDPLGEALVICGVPKIWIKVDSPDLTGSLDRIVVRLSHVDNLGRSVLIGRGVATRIQHDESLEIELEPTAYRVPSGQRIRVALCDADFPRLAPLERSKLIALAYLRVELPVVSAHNGAPANVPLIENSSEREQSSVFWNVLRDPLRHGVEVTVGRSVPSMRTPEGHRIALEEKCVARVMKGVPGSYVATGVHNAKLTMAGGEKINVDAVVRCTQTNLWARGRVVIDGFQVYERSWDVNIGEPEY